MTFTRQESAALDRYLTQGPPDDPMWCPHCQVDSEDCEQPEDHMDNWITYERKAYESYMDDAYDASVDA